MGVRDALHKASVSDPFAAFQFANLDDAGDPNYFGYCALSGSWVIKRFNVSTGVMTIAAGADDYAAAWTARASHTYATPDQIL